MFQSEHLQEKWSPLLDYEGVDPIKDAHRRAVTIVLLENQEKFLREEQAFGSGLALMETPTNARNDKLGKSGGFSGTSPARSYRRFRPSSDLLDQTFNLQPGCI